jgi:hypothetical protein
MSQTKKSSPAKVAAARTNGAKSAGPKSADGKQKSSLNSIKHGGTCSVRTPLVLPGENLAEFQRYSDAFYDHFCPQNLAESALVDTLVALIWKVARITGFEAERLTSAAEDLHGTLGDQYESMSITRLFALAFQDSTGKAQSPLTLRYLVSCRNMFRSALNDFVRLRQAKGNPDEPYLRAPRYTPVIQSFCIDPTHLPVPDLNTTIIEPATDFAAPPEPDLSAHSEEPPPPPPAPVKEPVAEPQPESIFDEPPMLPTRDASGAIHLNMAGQPIMMPNSHYVFDPAAPRKPLPSYDVTDFPGERFNTKFVPFDPRFTSDGRLRNEPKPPATPYSSITFKKE